MKRAISTCDTPTLRQNVLFIERLEGAESQSFVVYSDKLLGFETHWTGSKTVPCWKDHRYCEGGHTEESLRQNFLLQCYSVKRGKQVFLYLTPSAAKQLQEQVTEGTSLRGLAIRVRRTEKKKGRLYVEVEQHAAARRIVSPEIDPYESIMRFLRVPQGVQESGQSLGTIPLPDADLVKPRKRLKALGG